MTIAARLEAQGEDVTDLQELLLYGLKGMAAYADHALILGKADEGVFAFFHEALDFLTRPEAWVIEYVEGKAKADLEGLEVFEFLANLALQEAEPSR